MGPYYLTALVNLLGPAKEVLSQSEKGKKKELLLLALKKVKSLKLNVQLLISQLLNF